MNKCKLLSIVIPAFNESENLLSVIELVKKSCSNSQCIEDFEIIIVDDHSSDNSFHTISSLKIEKVKIIRLSRNSGSHTAIRAGISCARGDAFVFLSADGQDDPSVIPDLINKWQKGVKTVWAVRESREKESLRVRIPAAIFYFFMKALIRNNIQMSKMKNADFCLVDKIVYSNLKNIKERNINLFYLICWMGFREESVVYKRKNRQEGESKWTLFKKIELALNSIFASSVLPIKLLTIFGFVMVSISFVVSLVLTIFMLNGKLIVVHFIYLIVLSFMFGLQMMALGILGEYLWRNFDVSRNHPLFIVEDSNFQIDY